MAESSLKEKLLGIIFEPEPESDTDNGIERIKKGTNEASRLKAEDLLYDKNKDKEKPLEQKEKTVGSGTFINYSDRTPSVKEPENDYGEYVSSPNISPIFGLLDGDAKNRKNDIPLTGNPTTEMPNTNHLGMVMSPIYGNSTKKANEQRSKTRTEEKEEETIVDFDITEDLGDIFGSDEFKQEAEEEEQTYTEEIDLFSDFYISEDK